MKVRILRIYEMPMLLKFKSENDYYSPIEGKVPMDPLYKTLLKCVWHSKRLKILGAFNEDRKLVGYGSIVVSHHKNSSGTAHIANIAVGKSERGKGVGTVLMQAIEDLVRSQNVRRIELEVFSSNQSAIRLYERLNYETEGVKRRVVENNQGSDDLVLMAKLMDK